MASGLGPKRRRTAFFTERRKRGIRNPDCRRGDGFREMKAGQFPRRRAETRVQGGSAKGAVKPGRANRCRKDTTWQSPGKGVRKSDETGLVRAHRWHRGWDSSVHASMHDKKQELQAVGSRPLRNRTPDITMGTVRTARIDDAVRIRDLLGQLGYETSSSFVEDRLSLSQNDLLTEVLVGESGGFVVAVASLHAFDLFHRPGRIGRITAFVVDASARGKGMGSVLLKAADSWFRHNGCVRAEVTSGDHRPAAHAFYEFHGYQPDERRFLKRFDQ